MKTFAESFIIMLGFFTRLPVPKVVFTDELYRRAMILMPLAGLVIGAILVLIQFIMSLIGVPGLLCGAILTGAYIFLTGGLHFDGLADTFDGIFSGRSKEQSLEIMKDSRIGVFGTIGLFVTGLFYFAAFTMIPICGLLVFPMCGRACCLLSASMTDYARTDGMGKPTSQIGGPGTVIFAVLSLIGATLLTKPLFILIAFFECRFTSFFGYGFLPLKGAELSILACPQTSGFVFMQMIAAFIAICAAILVTIYLSSEFRKKLGGVTGDTFGAVIEITSIVFLYFFIILTGVLTS